MSLFLGPAGPSAHCCLCYRAADRTELIGVWFAIAPDLIFWRCSDDFGCRGGAAWSTA